MMRGTKPTPTHLKIIEGNPGKRAIHGNEPEPVKEIPEPPAELNDDARLEWERVAAELYRVNLLSRIDRAALTSYCAAWGRWVVAERGIKEQAKDPRTMGGLVMVSEHGALIRNPLVGIADKAAAAVVRYAAEFGMTASARSRLDSETPRAPNKFAGLIGQETA